MDKKLILCILDGWGIGNKDHSDAIFNAHTPFMDQLWQSTSHATLLTSGLNVGLPDGQMGNSEVGHLNIGAGRIVHQDLVKINLAIENGGFKKNKTLLAVFQYCKSNNKKLHLMGLVSDGGVHSSQNHLHHLIQYAREYGLEKIHIHAFTDGRDTDPKSGLQYIGALKTHCDKHGARLSSVIGRYFAMDRDQRWERVKKAYDLLRFGIGEKQTDAADAIQNSYDNGISDEFIEPICITDQNGNYHGQIEENDAVICFNFRTDRCREISRCLTQESFPEFDMQPVKLHYCTMTQYDETYKNVRVLFTKNNLKNTLGELMAKAGKKQIRISETEKYPHVTFFFSGGRETPFEGEKRILINSPKVATYDLQPQMSAVEVKEAIIKEINAESADFICLNFANADMVGHTGVYSAITKAVECVDACLAQVVNAAKQHQYSCIVIADHGNADFAINKDGTPNTAHSLNPVPFVVLDSEVNQVGHGILADIAPTILEIMGIKKPKEMTGKSLIK